MERSKRGMWSIPSYELSPDTYALPQFDSLVQTATGFNVAEAEAYAAYQSGANKSKSDAATEVNGLQPRPLPMQALDHAAGYLLAFGINTALCKTITVRTPHHLPPRNAKTMFLVRRKAVHTKFASR